MTITGIDTIDGKQIIAAGAVSAKSAEIAYNDENGNPITGYQVAGNYYSASNPSGFISEVPDTYLQNTDLSTEDGKVTAISGIPLSADGGSTYSAGTGIDITNDVISIDNTVALKTDIPEVPSAGNMLSVTNNTIDVTTTVGITDIQLVNSLPASPVSSVLYLIPEA